jgi:DNA-binding response OmpR family regulator
MTKVLIAEDDMLIADMIEDVLVTAGYDVCGIARTVTEGVILGRRHRPDIAVLDLRLAKGGFGTEIAIDLAAFRRVGILYATGNVSQVTLTAGDACLVKPYSPEDLLRSLEIVAEIAITGEASGPYPNNLKLLGLEKAA